MLRRGFALLTILALSPAHAALIEYSFESKAITGIGGGHYILGDAITGGFLFDDAAPLISHNDYPSPFGLTTNSTYDMSNLSFWVTLGDDTFTALGDMLFIQATNTATGYDVWRLTMNGDGQEVDGRTVESMEMWIRGYTSPLTTADLQVTNPADWNNQCCVENIPLFWVSFTDGTGVNAQLLSITPTSVPEPATLSLLTAGILGTLATRRRRHAAANA
jgi:hypothetical protein